MVLNDSPKGGWQFMLDTPIASNSDFPKIFHSLTFNEDSIYFSGLDHFTYAINSQTGKVRWRHEEQDYSTYQANFGKENQLFSTNFDGTLYVIDKHTGQERWRFTTPDRTKIDTEPVLTDTLVLYGSRNGKLYALDNTTGNLQWSFITKPIDKSYYAESEAIFHFGRFSTDNNSVYLNSATEKKIFAIDQKTGEELWRINLQNYFFEKPVLYDSSISFWDTPDTYKLIKKTDGKILKTIRSKKEFLFEGRTCIYVINTNASIDCINPNTGNILWTVSDLYTIPADITETDSNITFFTFQNVDSVIVTAINTTSGIQYWSHSFGKFQPFEYHMNGTRIFLLGTYVQCALTFEGKITWCTNRILENSNFYLTTDGIYAISEKNDVAHIMYVNSANGDIRWEFISDDIMVDSIKFHQGDVYFIDKKNTKLVKLNSLFPKRKLKLTDLKTTRDSGHTFFSRYIFNQTIKDMIQSPKITIEAHEKFIQKHLPLELTFHMVVPLQNDSRIASQYMARLLSPTKKEYEIKAFYYDKNTWKFRFTPQEIGEWNWSVTHVERENRILSKGYFTVIDSKNRGFLSISKNNPRYFSNSDGNIFIPIGIQNCTMDLHQDGSPLYSWPLDEDPVGSESTEMYKTTSMNNYLSTYAEVGFNVFRWGVDNCSFSLWNFGNSLSFSPKINEGIFLDEILSSLKQKNYHVWMSLFSFNFPFDQSEALSKQQDKLKIYLDYVVARYAAYVDVWELANEITLSDSLITFMATYIKSIDPYKHPITTSWERPELKEIETVSAHWYSGECNEHCDQDMWKQVEKFEKYNKPIVFSEQGNNEASWDEYSATRYRIRLWMSFLMRSSLIFWNMPNVYFANKTGPSNIYIGPVERSYTSVFATLTSSIGTTIEKFEASTGDKRHKVYAVTSDETVYGYVYSRIYPSEHSTTNLSFELDTNATMQWIHPENGSILRTQNVQKGMNTVIPPVFTPDIIFKIIYDPD